MTISDLSTLVSAMKEGQRKYDIHAQVSYFSSIHGDLKELSAKLISYKEGIKLEEEDREYASAYDRVKYTLIGIGDRAAQYKDLSVALQAYKIAGVETSKHAMRYLKKVRKAEEIETERRASYDRNFEIWLRQRGRDHGWL